MTLAQQTAWLAARALRKVSRVLDRAAGAQTLAIQRGMSTQDMEADPDERYYAEQYWRWLEPEVARLAPDGNARVLEIGCGHGRLLLPLARLLRRGRVIGVDLTPAAINAARSKAAAQNLDNVELHVGDALPFVAALAPESFDLAVMTEVSFFMPQFRAVVDRAYRVLRRGGLLFASFRSQHYNLLHSVRDRDWPSARLAFEAREGEWGGSSTWFSWQTPDEVRAILTTSGFALSSPLRGIGVCSGIAGDPFATIAQPSALSENDRHQLMQIPKPTQHRRQGTQPTVPLDFRLGRWSVKKMDHGINTRAQPQRGRPAQLLLKSTKKHSPKHCLLDTRN